MPEKIKITPEIKQLLKRNFFYLTKPAFPSWYARDILISYFMIALAAFLAIYLQWTSFATVIMVITPVILAFYFAYKWFAPYMRELDKSKMMPTSDQMENWLIKDIKNIVKPAAVEMLSLNPLTITPDNFMIVIHPVYWETPGIDPKIISRRKVGDYFIYTVYSIQIIALSENYISYYSCVFNWLDNQIVSPYTLEFFFEDISSITSETQTLEYKFIDKDPEAEDSGVGTAKVVFIHNKSGEKMKIIVEVPSLQPSPRITLKAEKVMQVLRIMLRHRRFGELFYIEKKEEQPSENQENKEN